jgi:TRAP-type mannitol/chloroaromatic compound transport system permease large subunit
MDGDIMTTVAHEPDQVDIEELNRARQRNRILGTVVVVLAVAILALGAWLIYGLATDTETTATAEIDQVLTDYRTAADETDLDAFRAIVTDDFVVTFSSPTTSW